MRLVPSPVCDGVRRQISLDLDGELSQLERAMVARHVERCGDCRLFRDDVAHFTGAVRTTPFLSLRRPIDLPGLRRRALRRLPVGGMRLAAGVAAIAAVVSFGLTGRGTLSSALSQPPKVESAYLQSADYERVLIRQQVVWSKGSRSQVAV